MTGTEQMLQGFAVAVERENHELLRQVADLTELLGEFVDEEPSHQGACFFCGRPVMNAVQRHDDGCVWVRANVVLEVAR